MGVPIVLKTFRLIASAAWRRIAFSDRWLLGALAAGMLLGVQGAGWGRYDCLNLDRMAFQNVFAKDRKPLEPASFVKPPGYTYINLLAARWPAEFLARQVPGLAKTERRDAMLRLRVILSRALNFAMFGGLILLVFAACESAFGRPAARAAAWILATSAGFVPYKIFLTTDLAVVFFMATTFFLCLRIVRNPSLGLSVAAGLLAGLAGAIKYNGLAIAVCLPLAHLLASRGNPILACLRRPAAWFCGLAVPVGFLLGNPHALLSYRKFADDFLYNYTVTPVYNGPGTGTGYADFLLRYREIFGDLGSLLLAVALLAGIPAVLHAIRHRDPMWKTWLLAAAAFAVYFWKIGSFPRTETRFVLPTAPFVVVLAAAGFPILLRARGTAVAALAALVVYNAACGWRTGELFRRDPRMELLDWAAGHFEPGDVIESSDSMPQWKLLPNAAFTIHKIPSGLERKEAFRAMFAGDDEMNGKISRNESREGTTWFDPAARQERGTRWIAWSSIDLDSVTTQAFNALFSDPNYSVVFQKSSPDVPSWGYPKQTEFLRSQSIVWKRNEVR